MKHNPSLDGFRALAVSIVVFAHLFPRELYPYTGFQYGRIGVIGFFVLSGFLITHILLAYRSQIEAGTLTLKGAWKKFLVRRTLRIFPLYFGVLVLFGFLLGYERLRSDFWWHALYLSNFGQALHDKNFGAANHFWSLCVEEQFYLVWPALILLIPRKQSHRPIYFAIALSLLAAVVWAMLGKSLKFSGYIPLGGASFALASGAWLAHATHGGSSPGRWFTRRLVAIASALLFIAILGMGHWSSTAQQLITDLAWTAFAVAIILWLHKRENALLASPPLVWIGKISYGIYIYHLMLSIFFPQLSSALGIDRNASPLFAFFTELAFVLAVSAASYHFYEVKFLRLKTRLAP